MRYCSSNKPGNNPQMILISLNLMTKGFECDLVSRYDELGFSSEQSMHSFSFFLPFWTDWDLLRNQFFKNFFKLGVHIRFSLLFHEKV